MPRLWRFSCCWSLLFLSAIPQSAEAANSTDVVAQLSKVGPSASSLPTSTASGSIPVVVAPASASKEAEKPTDWFARVIAAIGVVLGVINFGWGIYKGKRDRRISIEDDFWFRKVITPATIEPLLKTFAGLFEDLPSRSTPAEKQAEFAFRITTEFAKLYMSMQTLELFDEQLPSLVCEKLRKCEDLLTDHSATLSHEDCGKDESASDLRGTVWAELRETLKVIKNRHLKQ